MFDVKNCECLCVYAKIFVWISFRLCMSTTRGVAASSNLNGPFPVRSN